MRSVTFTLFGHTLEGRLPMMGKCITATEGMRNALNSGNNGLMLTASCAIIGLCWPVGQGSDGFVGLTVGKLSAYGNDLHEYGDAVLEHLVAHMGDRSFADLNREVIRTSTKLFAEMRAQLPTKAVIEEAGNDLAPSTGA